MTAEERFDRIEHIVAGLYEERRKDREEYGQLWRDTQRQISELALRIDHLAAKTNESIDRLAEESRAAEKRRDESDKRLEARIDQLGGRIDRLVSGIGAFLSRMESKQ